MGNNKGVSCFGLEETAWSCCSDRISDLPDCLSNHILSLLPLKSMAQMSVLSKRWNSLWLSYPVLEISGASAYPFLFVNANEAYQKILDEQAKAIAFITKVLARRSENSQIAKVVRAEGPMSSLCFHDLIQQVVKHKVEELELRVLPLQSDIDVPPCLFECGSLTSLRLEILESTTGQKPFRFRLRAPETSSCLLSLGSLFLSGVNFLDASSNNSKVADLFSSPCSFPFLESLCLHHCKIMTGDRALNIGCCNLRFLQVYNMELDSLNITAMRLAFLTVDYVFNNASNNTCLVKIFAPCLRKLSWESNAFMETCLAETFPNLTTCHLSRWFSYIPVDRISMPDEINSTLNLLSASSQVQNLVITQDQLQMLSNIYFGGGLPHSFKKLETLCIRTGLTKFEIPGIACLLKSSPAAQSLLIHVALFPPPTNEKWNNTLLDDGGCTEEQYWESQAQNLSPFLRHLKVVKIHVTYRQDLESAIKVARFLLQHGRGLQEMILSSHTFKDDPPLWKDKVDSLEGLPRASPDVKISVASTLVTRPFLYL